MRNSTKLFRGAAFIGAFATSLTAWGFSFILNDDTGLPIKWPAGTVNIRVMLGTGTTLSDGLNHESSFQAAVSAWNTQLGNFRMTTTSATGTPAPSNGANEAAFTNRTYGGEFETNTLAITTVYYLGNERRQADILFNTAYTWDSYRGATRSGTPDIQRVAIHEIGHLLGLDHPDEDKQTVTAIMNSRISSVDALTTDDIQGSQSLYGPPGTPTNDAFANGTVITLGSSTTATLTGYNTNASKEAGEPSHAGNSGGSSVWWRWTSPSGGGSMKVDTRGSYFDTTLGIYTGTSVNALTTIASDDDIQNGVIQASELTFNAAGNTTYHFAVDGFDNDTAGIKLNLAFTPTLGTPPAITTQPSSTTVTAGGSAFFTVTATGTDPLAYQWLLNGSAISGATSATYTINSAQSSHAGNYTVTVTNAAGSVTSNTATLTVNPAPVTAAPSSGGGGGGGSPSAAFFALLTVLSGLRLRSHIRQKRVSPA